MNDGFSRFLGSSLEKLVYCNKVFQFLIFLYCIIPLLSSPQAIIEVPLRKERSISGAAKAENMERSTPEI